LCTDSLNFSSSRNWSMRNTNSLLKEVISATQIWNSTTNFDLSTPIFNYHHHTIIVMYKTAQKQHKTQIPPTTDKSELKITQRIPFSNPNSHEHENWEHFKDYITKSNLKLKSTITSFVFLGFEVLKIRKEERERMVELAFLDALYSTRVFLFFYLNHQIYVRLLII
jgi:hypothetical protein